jgi:hypothetical protein
MVNVNVMLDGGVTIVIKDVLLPNMVPVVPPIAIAMVTRSVIPLTARVPVPLDTPGRGAGPSVPKDIMVISADTGESCDQWLPW